MFDEKILLIDEYKEDGKTLIYQYIIPNCQLDFNTKKSYNIKGEVREYKAACIVKLPLNTSESYTTPKVWEKLSPQGKAVNLTIREGQLLVLTNDYLELNCLQDALVQCDYAYRVERVDTYRGTIPHLEVYCS